MPIAANLRTARQVALPKMDRRRHQRVKVDLLGRFMLSNKQEYACQVVDMSPGGAGLVTPVRGEVGERVIAYIDQIGRIEGKIARLTDLGFAMTVETTIRKRDKLAAQLTWLANRHVLNLPEDRRHERYTPKNPFATLTLADGRELRCRILDVSMSGAGLAVTEKPRIGSAVTLGRMRARVVRHFEDGIAIEFAATQTPSSIDEQIG